MIKRGMSFSVSHIPEIRIYYPPFLLKGFVSTNKDTKIRIIRERNKRSKFSGDFWDIRVTSNSPMETISFNPKNKFSFRCFMEKATLQLYFERSNRQ